jgi:stage IV sporulation protein FB
MEINAVLLTEPESTPLDLRFRLFGTPVRVHPFFWLITAMLGWSWYRHPVLEGNGLADLALWVFCVFFSILLHEFGHIWMGRLFGSEGYILLHGMGGLAIGSNNLSSRGQRILVSFAGPGIQLLLFAVLFGLKIADFWPAPKTPTWLFFFMLFIVNLFWPLINLLPIWPLDGGMITREICTGISPSRGLLVSLWISLIVCVVLAVNSLMGEYKQAFIPYAPADMFMAIWFAFFAASSFQAIQMVNSQRRSCDDDLPWER